MNYFSLNIFLQFSGQCAGAYDCGFCWLSMQRRGNEEFPRAKRVPRSQIHSNEMAHKHPRATYYDYSDSACDYAVQSASYTRRTELMGIDAGGCGRRSMATTRSAGIYHAPADGS